MAHFAKVVDGVVENVIVAEQDHIDTLEGNWVQTSYNTRGGVHVGQDLLPDGGVALRKNFAGTGFMYDSVRDAFYEPKPYPSWILDEDTCWWNPPVAYPTDDKFYKWDEDTLSWVEEGE